MKRKTIKTINNISMATGIISTILCVGALDNAETNWSFVVCMIATLVASAYVFNKTCIKTGTKYTYTRRGGFYCKNPYQR